jgi:hypothetical protein
MLASSGARLAAAASEFSFVMSGASGTTRFGAAMIVPRPPKLAERHPELTIDLRLEDQLVDLAVS